MKRLLFGFFLLLTLPVMAQTAWYNSAQARIDTLRKGPFAVRVVDALGAPIQDSVRVVLKKHAFPWGYAVDLSYGSTSVTANRSSTSSGITSVYGDNDAYKAERWGKYFAYYLPATSGKSYRLILKFAELYFSAANSRLFDVYIDGVRVLNNFDKYALANGKFVALDSTFNVTATSNRIKVEFYALKDNASINALELLESTGASALRVWAGSSVLSLNGKSYLSDDAYLSTAAGSRIATADDWTKSIMLRYCNYGVCGNQFKWSGIEPNKGVLNYAPFESTFNWFKSVGWDMRAHTLLWGAYDETDYHSLPKWVMDLRSNPKSMYDTCLMRVRREVTRYKGVVKEYDVMNEPTHAKVLRTTVGDSINWNCFKVAHAADPNARLFVNDFNIIEWQNQTDDFVNLVRTMLNNGAPVTGIGAQCHIGSSVDLTNFKSRFDQLAQFGLPIKVTEFDMNAKSLTEQQYAVEMAKMMRLCFSHPAIEGFIFWGLTEPTWADGIINVIREDKTTKIAADTIYKLIHEEWHTDVAGTTDVNGMFSFKGYYGDYDVLVKVNGTWKRFPLSCLKVDAGKTFNVVSTDGVAPRPVFKRMRIVAPNQIYLTFDAPMSNPSAQASNFRVFDQKLNYIASAALKGDDSTTIVLTTGSTVDEKDYLPVSYMGGTVASSRGGLLAPTGLLFDDRSKPTYLSASTNVSGTAIQLNFDTKLVDSTVVAPSFVVSLNGKRDTVTAATLSVSKDYCLLTLKDQVSRSSDVVTISYVPGNLTRVDQLYVASFQSRPVTKNIDVPLVASAAVNTAGTKIFFTFDQTMTMPVNPESFFSIKTYSGRNVGVQKIDPYGTDKRSFLLTLSTPVLKGDSIWLNYTPGNLCATTGVFVDAFKYKANNMSIVTTDVDRVGSKAAFAYPSPFRDVLNVNSEGGYTQASLFDLNGTRCLNRSILVNGETQIATQTLPAGAYMLVLSKSSGEKVSFKVVKE
jgi:uncharacterized repeat protein (TIGR02059 family)